MTELTTELSGVSPKNHPAFKGNGITVWSNTDKNGNEYLNVQMVGHNDVPAWKFVPKALVKNNGIGD